MKVIVNVGFTENVEFDDANWHVAPDGKLTISRNEEVVALFVENSWTYVQKIHPTPAVETQP